MNNYADITGKIHIEMYNCFRKQYNVATWCINWYNIYAEMSEYLTKMFPRRIQHLTEVRGMVNGIHIFNGWYETVAISCRGLWRFVLFYGKKEDLDFHSTLSGDGSYYICLSVCGIITYEHIRVHFRSVR